MNKQKALERELVYLRKRQNRTVVDRRRLRRLQKVRTQYWRLLKRKRWGMEKKIEKVESKEKEKTKKKKVKEPELEIIEETDIDDLYALDDEEFEEEDMDEVDETTDENRP